MEQGPKRAAIYCRLSRDDDSSTSIATQEEDGRALCRLRGWEVALVAVDVNVSGSIRPEDREGFRQILDAAGQLDVVVARSVDRYSRNTGHFAQLVETLDAHGIAPTDTQGLVDLTTPYGRFVTQIMVAFAELERGTIQQRILRSRVELRSAGKWLGGAAPYGFRLVPHTEGGKRLEIDPKPAAVLREVARRVSAGVTLSSEVDRLNRTGVLSPADYRKALRGELPPPFPGYARWSYPPLYEHLRSEVLRGYRVQGKRGVRKAVRDASGAPVRVGPPLLSDGEWEALQRALNAAAQTNRRPRTKASLLLHVARCGLCGETLYRNAKLQRGKDASFYACRAAKAPVTGPKCPGVAVSAARLESHVSDWFLSTRGDLHYLRRTLTSGTSAPAVDELRADVEELAATLPGLRGTAKDAVLRQLEARQAALDEAVRVVVEEPRWEVERTGQTIAQRWEAADTAERRLMLLSHGVQAVVAPAEGRVWNPSRVALRGEDPMQDELDAIMREVEAEDYMGPLNA
ncbi:recombinase family protein [Streptomyces ovatisporus]|uniref:Recombinase family protein n=1 Tax=Streptomyces ovatisporus TaxID=1128682 RepID=A0ABV9A3G6_9ACTN